MQTAETFSVAQTANLETEVDTALDQVASAVDALADLITSTTAGDVSMIGLGMLVKIVAEKAEDARSEAMRLVRIKDRQG